MMDEFSRISCETRLPKFADSTLWAKKMNGLKLQSTRVCL